LVGSQSGRRSPNVGLAPLRPLLIWSADEAQKAETQTRRIEMKRDKNQKVQISLTLGQAKDLRDLLKIEADRLAGRPSTDFIARKYESILKIVKQV